MKNPHYVWGVILSLFIGLCYGMAVPFSKMLASSGISPMTIVLYRTVFSSIFWAVVLYLQNGWTSFRIDRSVLFYFALIGFFSFVLKSCGLIMSYKYLTVQFAIMLNYLAPICTIFLNSYLNKEKPRVLQIFASLLVVFGLVYAFNGFGEDFSTPLLGLFFAAISVAGSSLNTAYCSFVVRKYKPGICQQIFYCHFSAVILLFVIKSFSSGWGDMALITPNAFFNLNMVALATGVCSTFCFCVAVRLISSSTLQILSSTEILMTLILVPLIAGILPTGREIIGSIIIFIALAMATVSGKES